MQKTCLCITALLITCLPTLAYAAPYFYDNFQRLDSDSTGNGWTDEQVGSGTTWGISNGRGFSTGNDNGQDVVYRTDIATTSGIIIKGTVSSATLDHNYFKTGVLSAQGYNQPGYFIILSGTANISIRDESGILASSPFGFNDTDEFSYEWDITAAPQNWSYLYVWDADTGSKPATPNLSWTNGGNNFSPITSGNRFYYTNAPGSLINPTETMYDYLYEVDPLDTTPPSLSSVSVSSNNASTTLAKIGDSVTLDFTASEAVETPIVTIAGRSASIATTTGNSFEASTTMETSYIEGVVPFSIALTDLAGNVGFVTSTTTNNSSVTFDKTAPNITISDGPADGATSTSAVVSFDFSVDDSSATVLCTFDYATISACTSPFATTTTNGSHVFSITATDGAGNTASTSRSLAVAVPPPVTSQPSSANTGGSQPVGSSPTAPGYQTVSTIASTAPTIPIINASDTQGVPEITQIVANANQASATPKMSTQASSVSKPSQTDPSEISTTNPSLATNNIEDTQNQAAVAQSSFDLTSSAWPLFLALLLIIDVVWLYPRLRRN